MDNHTLSHLLQNYPYTASYFQGVFAADTLPNIKRGACYVINTDNYDEPGQHWTCIFAPLGAGSIEYFDSYGRPMIGPVVQLLGNQKVIYNTQQLQSLYSDVCGHYIVYYLLHRCRGHSMQSIVNRFTKDVHRNDKDVYYFITNT